MASLRCDVLAAGAPSHNHMKKASAADERLAWEGEAGGEAAALYPCSSPALGFELVQPSFLARPSGLQPQI